MNRARSFEEAFTYFEGLDWTAGELRANGPGGDVGNDRPGMTVRRRISAGRIGDSDDGHPPAGNIRQSFRRDRHRNPDRPGSIRWRADRLKQEGKLIADRRTRKPSQSRQDRSRKPKTVEHRNFGM